MVIFFVALRNLSPKRLILSNNAIDQRCYFFKKGLRDDIPVYLYILCTKLKKMVKYCSSKPFHLKEVLPVYIYI